MEENKRIVRIVANDKRYTKAHFRSVPVWKENWNTYLTGQHINPEDESTSDNLTMEQMLGKQPLTKEQRIKYGYVINPEDGLLIKHNVKLDLSIDNKGNPVNHKDYWEYIYLQHQTVVAASKAEYNIDTHRFYIEDKITEAEKSISKREKIYSAVEQFRKNLTMDKMSDIALMLNYYVPTFRVDPRKISKVVLEEMIYEQCEKNPEHVLKCFGPSSQMETYILRMCDKGILRRMGNDFFYGDVFVGQGLEKVQTFMTKEDNRATVNKWASLMKEDTNFSQSGKDSDSEAVKLFADGLTAIISKDAAKVSYIKKRLFDMNAETYLNKIVEAEKQNSDIEDEKQKTSSEDNVNEDVKLPSLLTLKQQAGKLGIDKSIYQNMNQEELFEYLKDRKAK